MMHPLITDRESKEAHHTTYSVTVRTLAETRDQSAQTTVPYETFHTEQAERAVQALSVTVKYLAFEVRGHFVLRCAFSYSSLLEERKDDYRFRF